MSDRDARFRRLRPDGDLFAHFGIELEPAVATPAVRGTHAVICSSCRWYVKHDEDRCRVCGTAVVPSAGAST